jgi:hypothetical protein
MSTYQVAKFCHDCLIDLEVRELAISDPSAALDRYDLSADEREMLLRGDVGGLYEAGCVEFLLSYLPRWGVFGLDVPTYAARMRAATVRPA